MGGGGLVQAAYNGNTQRVLWLLDVRKVNANSAGGKYGSALCAAAYGGEKGIVSLLLDRGADVNITCSEYGSALGAAAYRRHRGVVSLLLDRGTDVNIAGGKYGTALVAAAYHGQEHILSLLIVRGANVNAASSLGQYGTALAAAALQGNKTVVSLLLGFGANTNIVSRYYGTALAAASYKRYGDIMSELLEYSGTDINTIGGKYGTALGAAIAGRGASSSHITKQKLLDHGADINLVDGRYGSQLGKAAYQGNGELVSLLLAAGADAFHVGGEYKTVTGEYPTALDAARAGSPSEDIITLLSRIMNDPVQKRDTTPWPPFPMPFTGSLEATQAPYPCHDCLEAINNQTRMWDGNLTPVQADLPCKVIDEELLRRVLVALVGIHEDVAERLQVRLEP